ncbi:hypothetical protein JXQ70_07860 [bacterium]|nr:hypothetical protein [bacterium]
MTHHSLFDLDAKDESEQEGSDVERINTLWHYYVDLRGAPLLPTCKEIEALLLWMERAIPDAIIKKAMNQSLAEKELDARRKGLGLHHCHNEVRRLYRQYLDRELSGVTSERSADQPAVRALSLDLERTEMQIRENVSRLPLTARQQNTQITHMLRWLNKRARDGKCTSLEHIEKTLDLLNRRHSTLLMKSVSDEEILLLETESQQVLAHYLPTFGQDRMDTIVRSFVLERLRNRYQLKSFAVHSLLQE